ncbi:cysteine protease [Mycobacterium phage Zenteno07]|nr:cysteine protease [Mycobacterium phage Zenteno07]
MRATGRLLLHDPQSRNYEAPRAAVRPASVLHTLGPVLNQRDVNGCVGWTGANLLNASKAASARTRYNRAVHPAGLGSSRGRAYLGDADGVKLYELATRNDPFRWTYPPTDGGSSGLGLGKALKALGVIEGYDWTFDFGQLIAHAQRQPVALGIIWTDPMNDPDAKGLIHIGTDRDVKRAADRNLGHEVTLRGINWPRKLARIRNQWGASWGLKGDALIPLDELERLVIDHRGDCMVPRWAT